MSSSKNFSVKGLCGRCSLEIIDWRDSQSCLCFRPSFVNYCPSNVLSDSPPPPPPPFCNWLDSEPTKLPDHPKQKSRRGGGLKQINTCRKGPLQVDCFRWRHFALLSISLIFLRIKIKRNGNDKFVGERYWQEKRKRKRKEKGKKRKGWRLIEWKIKEREGEEKESWKREVEEKEICGRK